MTAEFQAQVFQLPAKAAVSFARVCATKGTGFSLGGWVGRTGGTGTTKAICGTLTKDYAWMGLHAFDAFQDGQTET